MKIAIPGDALAKAMALCSRVSMRGYVIPCCQHVRIEAGDTIRITRTNLEIYLTVKVEGEIAETGVAIVPAAELQSLAKIAGKALIEIDATLLVARVSFSGSSAEMHMLPEGDFPQRPPEIDPRPCDGKLLADALAICSPAISTEETKYYLNGVFFQHVSGIGYAVATNGHQMHSVAMPDTNFGCGILPHAAVSLVAEVAAGGGPVRFSIDERRWCVGSDAAVAEGPVIDATFPDWQRVRLADRTPWVIADREALASAVRLAQVGMDRRSRLVVIDAKDGAITVRGLARGDGPFAKPPSASFEADVRQPLLATYNADYLLDGLEAMDCDEVAIAAIPDGRMEIEPRQQVTGMHVTATIMGVRASPAEMGVAA